MTITLLQSLIADIKPRSAWDRGVLMYAHELLENLHDDIESGYQPADICDSPKLLEKALLNGARDWNEYSWGGCSLISDYDIARRLCNATELKRTHNGDRDPNKVESWLDVQGRALWQAATRIIYAAK